MRRGDLAGEPHEDADAQPSRIGAHLLGERPARRRSRVGVAGLVAGKHVEQGGRVAHRPRHHALVSEAGEGLAEVGAEGDAGARRLQADDAALARRDADRPAAVVRMRGRHQAGSDRRRRAAARATRRAARVPGVARRAVGVGLGRRQRAELGRVRLAEEDEARGAEPRGRVGVVRRHEAEALEQAGAHVVGVVGRVGEQVLQEERHAAKGPAWQVRRRRLGARLLEERDDDRVQLRVDRLDAGNGRVDERRGAEFAAPHQLGLGGGVEGGEFVRHAGTVRQPGARAQEVV